GGGLSSFVTREARGAFERFARVRPPGGTFSAGELAPAGPASDPTRDDTFTVLARAKNRGRTIWSDLHFAELDARLPEAERRVVLSVQRALHDADGALVGVARVALDPRELDAIASARAADADPDDPSRTVLLATAKGPPTRAFLVARAREGDPLMVVDDATHDLRFSAAHAPPEVAALLASPAVAALDPAHPNGEAEVESSGTRYAATMRELAIGEGPQGTEGWFVAVLAPKAYYTRELDAFLRLFVVAFALTVALVVAGGALALASVHRGLAKVAAATERMRRFDFEKSDQKSALREIADVIDGLERAKTVVRAMGKYVPIDLVRRLYASNQDPALGGQLADVTLLFTDIEGFTTLSEKLPPDELAQRLGDYLQAMTDAIEATGGTIDKYVGDAVMAFWNAPNPVADHPKAACDAVLACMRATRELYASSKWKGLPPLVTRYGLHRATVMVGHFGAPARLTYTALGDGVNLAARLEPLCKQYGVVALASEAVVEAAKDAIVFRRVDRVAVKGKTRGIDVFELLGARGEPIANADVAARYEAAFEAYLARDFDGAIARLREGAGADAPSAVLLARCEALRADPPPPGWDGVHVAKSK
ncbi:MAG TPA: adenylate/guanylate cyclase domain-containing protein, partial [Minicystis sp.]|nr:adenylate/guanylate cyclase domain-containing protein [Minicystis sp.]